jgi:hypothetical protein
MLARERLISRAQGTDFPASSAMLTLSNALDTFLPPNSVKESSVCDKIIGNTSR